MMIVLDANVVSERTRSRPDTTGLAGQATNSMHRIHFQ